MPFLRHRDLSPSGLRARLRRTVRRRRRPLAALVAGLGTFVALASLRAPAAVPETSSGPRPPLISAGQVAVPVTLSPPGLVRVLHVGQQVDLVSVGTSADEPAARLVTSGARIVSLPESGSTFSPTSSTVVVVAIDEADSLDLLATSSRDSLTVMFRADAGSG